MKLNKLAMIGTFAIAAISSQAFAAQDATVNFNARLVAATCDISASKDLVNLGTHSLDKVTDITQAISESNFNLVLNKCTKVYDDEAQAKEVSILATGESLTGHSEMFADAQSSQIGVKLTGGDAKTPILPNTETTISGLKVMGDNDYIVPVVAGLYATTKDGVVAQKLNVPVTFSVAYD
ncbi:MULTISPECIES: fimbrial protein [Providencia]|uniref:Fimbrial-type adhesion domain-containing protein n=1 Tax=Providencia heimbachae ATCC 35613 TaxID=1354272 RepID=A0A1B7JMI0_9GAMM|nr:MULTISPECIES: fimbrial protein [Providencia]MBP6122102.1 type 1 fimbrial protein [Providencia sp.]NIH21705.1 type 1 fimbrial protein [Providencia heimbachae]OAT49118.1 hypothetical protein M998_3094 [Providencia heimbachae ATCC 35613]SQH12316.1 P pilus assembly protein, pilin FimA [Providencia heimbachae]